MKKLKLRSELVVNPSANGGSDRLFKRTRIAQDELLQICNLYAGLSQFRDMAIRCRRFTFGDQWGDMIPDPDNPSRMISEGDNIKRNGKVPLKNNMIRQFVKSVIGQFASNKTEPIVVAVDREDQGVGEMMSTVMKYAYEINKMWSIDCRTFERFLISSVVCDKVTYGWNDELNKVDAWVEEVNPMTMFFDNTMQDQRGWDCKIIGELHSYVLEDVISKFGDNDPEKVQWLKDLYATCDLATVFSMYPNLSANRTDYKSVLSTNDGTCRVIEVWRRESKERYRCHDTLNAEYFKIDIEDITEVIKINDERRTLYKSQGIDENDIPLIEYEPNIDRYWVARWLSPFGDILKEMETPYWHKSHPYVFKLYPFYDGEVHSFVEDIIDQQKYINRLISMLDFIVSTSAKGVLMFPEDQMPTGMTPDDIAEQWTNPGGMIFYKPKPGVAIPQQISSNSTNIGAYELLNMQTSLMREISGVHAALQGQQSRSGTAASLYAQESQNSANNLVDLLESFNSFREARDTKLMKVIQQFYTDKRYIGIAGKDFSEEAKHFDPEKVKNVEFDLKIHEASTTVAYRQMYNDMLLKMFEMTGGQLVDAKMVLENGDFPGADRLLQSIDRKEKEIQAQQQELQAQQMALQAQEAQEAQQAQQVDEQAEQIPQGLGAQQIDDAVQTSVAKKEIPPEIRKLVYH